MLAVSAWVDVGCRFGQGSRCRWSGLFGLMEDTGQLCWFIGLWFMFAGSLVCWLVIVAMGLWILVSDCGCRCFLVERWLLITSEDDGEDLQSRSEGLTVRCRSKFVTVR
ncbi:unnamed protein product [Ilex paraguariensis]|uniref:Transmembrane protein n=1 Tax=Ilex paraguariensis TaxID=185542 RepID=A0ABC8TSU1_9AQUA